MLSSFRTDLSIKTWKPIPVNPLTLAAVVWQSPRSDDILLDEVHRPDQVEVQLEEDDLQHILHRLQHASATQSLSLKPTTPLSLSHSLRETEQVATLLRSPMVVVREECQ